MLDGMSVCGSCERPTATAWVESSHATSEGVVRYVRCGCGHRWVEIARLVLVADGPQRVRGIVGRFTA